MYDFLRDATLVPGRVARPRRGQADASRIDGGTAVDAGFPLPECTRVAVWPEDTIAFSHTAAGGSSSRLLRVESPEDIGCRVAVELSGPDADAFRLSRTAETDVVADGFVRLRIDFSPQRTGAHQAEVQIADVRRTLTATAGAEALLIVPPDLDFGTALLNCPARERAVHAFNNGTESLRFIDVDLAQSHEVFSVRAPPPTSLGSGDRLIEVSASYFPTERERYAGALTLNFERRTESERYIVDIFGLADEYEHVDLFTQLEWPSIDLVIVVDDSPSMADKRIDLVDRFGRFYDLLTRVPRELNLSVTTTDISAAGPAGRLLPLDRPDERIIRGSSAEAVIFTRNVDVGASGSTVEAPLEAAYRALTPPLVFGHNAGALERDHILTFLFVSDADDQSPQTEDYYINFYISIKGFRGGIVVPTALLAPQQGSPACPSGASPDDIEATGGQPRLVSVTNRMGGFNASMCDPMWPERLAAFFDERFWLKGTFFLSREVRNEEVEVFIDDVRTSSVVNGQQVWRFDVGRNAVAFERGREPRPGSSLRFVYNRGCLQ